MMRFRQALTLSVRGSIRCVFQSKAFVSVSKELPLTPEGKNPYDVLEITVTNATSFDDVSKQFRELVVINHPDRPGGSHERMSEVNAAYKIIKEHHNKLIQRLKEYEANTKGNENFKGHKYARARRDDDLGRSGGVYRRNAKAAEQSSGLRGTRSLREIESNWRRFQEETEHSVSSMCNRYELAVEKGRFFRKTSMLNEITVRERWLRKSFMKNVWEEVHELRGELLHRGARSAQQSQLAEEMVAFASSTQRKLNEDFQRLTQLSFQSQSQFFLQRVLFALLLLVTFIKVWGWIVTGMFRNSLTAGHMPVLPEAFMCSSVHESGRAMMACPNADSERSAAFDPFDGVDKDEATQVKIKWWANHVNQVLDSHRSPFVAAEILLQQMNEYGNNENITEDLLLATVLPVLHRCAFCLGTYGDLLEKALHEVLPAIMFARTYAFPHGEVLQRRPYAECFACIRRKFNYHVHLSSILQRKVALEEEVMTRVVCKLDKLWLKMCFRAWCGLCLHVHAKKRCFQRLAARGAALRVVPGFVRSWRRYAHEVTLREKLLKHDGLTREIEELYHVEQVVKSRYESIFEEVREKHRLLETTTERFMEVESRLKVLEGILDETVLSLRAHWKSWNETTVSLFSDTNEFQPPAVGNLRADLQSTIQNITDTATFYLREAQKRACKLGKNTISQFLSRAKMGGEIAERPGPDDLIAMVTSVCNPVTSPLRLVDVVRDDQRKYDLTLKFLACVNDGGHCSLFTQHEFPSEDEFSTDFFNEHGKEMVAHVATGVDSLHFCPATNEKYIEAIRNCLTAEELNKVGDYLGRVFCELAAAGLPLQKAKIEGCICPIVEPHDRQIVRALYPSQGIKSIDDMINYLLSVSHLTSWTISSLVEHLENNYDADPKEDLFTALSDEAVINYFNEQARVIDSLFSTFKGKRSQVFFSKELIHGFLIAKFGLLSSEVDTLFSLGAVQGRVTKGEFNRFLIVLAAFVNPSPFVSMAEKLAAVVRLCIDGKQFLIS